MLPDNTRPAHYFPAYIHHQDGTITVAMDWSCPNGHHFAVDGYRPKFCPGCGTSTLKREEADQGES